TIMVGVILFWSAANSKRGWGWALVGVYALWVAANAILLIPRHPELLAERAQRSIEGMKSWDKTLLGIIGIATLAKYILAGLDIRNSWSTSMPVWVHVAALLLSAFGYALSTWAMTENAYFSMIVRYQEDRGHRVCNTGPYKFVRHPAYIGTLLFEMVVPFLLGSWWTLIPSSFVAILMVIRTALEDRALQAELPGYIEFTGETRFRLLPGIW
ncbi:MAG: isoprenylcysteine carboxylmethyltransferase family protein, partial [Chloroflexi bacterium]|nr:isoprenylcysteine carboxylmethyltransferase family protein [Chloroflexota bacterium]